MAKVRKQNTDSISKIEPNFSNAHEYALSTLKSAKWFYDLTVDEQAQLERETEELVPAIINYGMSRLQLGAKLHPINQLLAQYNVWGDFAKLFNFSLAKANKLVAGYRNVANRINEQILQQAIISGIDLIGNTSSEPFGKYTQAVNEIDVPAEAVSPQEAREWLMAVAEKQKELRKVVTLERLTRPIDYDEILRRAFMHGYRAVRKARNQDEQYSIVMKLCGMLLQSVGIGPIHDVQPSDVPQAWVRQRGRPRLAANSSGEESAA